MPRWMRIAAIVIYVMFCFGVALGDMMASDRAGCDRPTGTFAFMMMIAPMAAGVSIMDGVRYPGCPKGGEMEGR